MSNVIDDHNLKNEHFRYMRRFHRKTYKQIEQSDI